MFYADTCMMLDSTVCASCDCSLNGSVSFTCDPSGNCSCKGDFYGTKCNNRDCKVNNWLAWSTCPCGTRGPKSRTRTVQIHPKGNGTACPSLTDTGRCTFVKCDCSSKPGYYGDRCENRDCVLTEWSSWIGGCDCKGYTCTSNQATCQQSIPLSKTRSRKVKTDKDGNGRQCSNQRHETVNCGYCKLSCTEEDTYAEGICVYNKKIV